MKFFNAAFSFAKHSIWHDNTDDAVVFAAAKLAFDEIRKGCTHGRNFFRLAGQSGSGKTSQLFKSHCAVLPKIGISPLHIAVRNFAKFHPNYAQLSAKPDCRELTNGFALKVLICVLDMAFEAGYDIVLEIALLDKKFEKFILSQIKQQNYRAIYHILCVNKLLSDCFILKRKAATKRATFSSSSDYFYFAMNRSLKYLSTHASIPCCLWSAYDLLPVYRGNISRCLPHFLKTQQKIAPLTYSENQLLKSKITYLEELYRDAHV